MNDPQPDKAIGAALDRHDLLRENPFLVLGQLRNGKVSGGKYPIAPLMATRLREVAVRAKARLATAEMSIYDGHTVLDPEEGLWVPSDSLRDEAPLIDLLERIDDVQQLNATQVEELPLSFYAIGFGPDDDRLFFVREKAQHLSGAAKLYGTIDGPLRLVDKPLLSLDMLIDFILTDSGAVVFGANAFERFIQDPAEVSGHFEQSIDALAKQIPFAPAVLSKIKRRGGKSTMMRGRLRSILGRPYFATLTLDLLRQKITSKGLDPARFMDATQLQFDERDTMLVLKLLDQKVWPGDFDGQLYSTNAATPEKR